MARRTRRDLNVDEVIEAAVEILRDEGEAALSMRRLAAECGVTPMALYHHVEDKDAVLALAVDRVVGSALDVEPLSDWRSSMIEFGSAIRSAMLANPGAGAVFVGRPVVGPNMAIVTEHFFEVLERGGVTGTAAAEATDAIVLLTIGSIANDLTRPVEIREQLRNHHPDARTPRMLQVMDAYSRRDPESRYRLAIGWLLDGIERQRTDQTATP